MPTNTQNMNLQKPIPGSDFGVWGNELNQNLDLLDRLAVLPIQTFIQFGPSTLILDAVCPIVLCLATAGASDLNLTLPTASSNSGKVFHLTKVDSGVGSVILNTVGGQLINDSTTYTLFNQFQYVAVASDGTNWLVIFNN